jgi:hypothetical protein
MAFSCGLVDDICAVCALNCLFTHPFMLCRCPELLTVPLQQYRSSVGYFVGRGLSAGRLLECLGLSKAKLSILRLSLLAQPVPRTHSQVSSLLDTGLPLAVSLPCKRWLSRDTSSGAKQCAGTAGVLFCIAVASVVAVSYLSSNMQHDPPLCRRKSSKHESIGHAT